MQFASQFGGRHVAQFNSLCSKRFHRVSAGLKHFLLFGCLKSGVGAKSEKILVENPMKTLAMQANNSNATTCLKTIWQPLLSVFRMGEITSN